MRGELDLERKDQRTARALARISVSQSCWNLLGRRIRSHQENALKQNLGLGSVSIKTETLEHSSAACQPQEMLQSIRFAHAYRKSGAHFWDKRQGCYFLK
jgi:hypothetical protein